MTSNLPPYRDARRTPYKPEHGKLLRPKGIFSKMEHFSIDALYMQPNSYIESILVDEHPIAVIGMVVLWPGVAEVWSVISEEARETPISFHKCVLSSLVCHETVLKLHRTQMCVRADYEEGLRWAESLGFKSEGVMLKYGPEGNDFFRYARVK